MKLTKGTTKQYAYHFHVTRQLKAGGIEHTDGLLTRTTPILNGDDYQSAKLAIVSEAGFSDTGGAVMCALSLLHVTEVEA